jgi:hypothetical protein
LKQINLTEVYFLKLEKLFQKKTIYYKNISMSSINFRRLTLEDGQQFSAFLGRSFGEGFFSRPELYKHWHFDNPAGQSIIYGAFDGDKLVGTNALQWAEFNINQEKFRLVHSLSSATDTEYRSIIIRDNDNIHSIFTMLNSLCRTDAEQQGTLLTTAFPNNNSFNSFVKHLDFDDLGTVPILMDILRLAEITSLKCPKLSVFLSQLLTMIPQLGVRCRELLRSKPHAGINTLCVENIDEEWDRFANEITVHYPIMRIRHSAFIQWRFLKSPILKYKLLEARKNGKLQGYLVYLIYPWPEREEHRILCGYIVDFLVFPNDDGKKALYNLLCHARRDFISEKAVITTTIQHIPDFLQKIFFQAGFWIAPAIIAPRPIHFTIRKCIGKYQNNHDLHQVVTHLKNWFLTMGDNDII